MTTKKPAGITPSQGCYLLLKIYKNPPVWKPEIEELIADVYYKKNIDSPFSKQLEQIRLKPLFNKIELTNFHYTPEFLKLLLESVGE